jgi:hypothetical protein
VKRQAGAASGVLPDVLFDDLPLQP